MSRHTAPAVSVLMPFRDAERTLNLSVRSVLAQSLADFELLAVDDGSVDRGPRLMRAMARRDRRIRVLRSPGSGIVTALNYGLHQARGAVVARMDGDDCMHPERLCTQVRYLRHHREVAVVASRVTAFPRAQLGAGMREYLRWQDACLEPRQIATHIYVEAPVVHPSVMYRRERILAHGGYRAGAFPEDYELWLRLVRSGESLAKLPCRLLWWRVHEGSASRTDPRYARESFDALRCRYLASDPRIEGAPALAIWGAGRRTRRRAAGLLAAGHVPRVWIDIDPRKIGNRIDGIEVVAPEWLASTCPSEVFVLGYVASHGAREAMSQALDAMGYRAGVSYLMVG